jgi:hypothetical protein
VAGGAGGGTGGAGDGGGGGGAALGGAIFVRDGASLILRGGTFTGGGVTAGAGNGGGTNGAAAGTDLFLMSSGSYLFAPALGQTLTFNGSIADDSAASLPGGTYAAGAGAGAQVIVAGEGTVVYSAGQTYSYAGTTSVTNGVLRVNGTLANSALLISGIGTVDGNGTVGDVTLSSGTLAAGANGVGTLSTGNLFLDSGGTLAMQFSGSGAGQFDVLTVTGTIDLVEVVLAGALLGGFNPANGTSFLVIDNDGADAINGTFAGVSEGGAVNVGGRAFQVTYVGGTGNDVVLTAVANGTPGLTGLGPTAKVEQAGPAALPQILDGAVTFSDVEGNFNGGTLTVAGLLAEDTVSVVQLGFDPGQFLIIEDGAVDRLLFEGIDIGGISGGAGANLDITFNGSATTAAVDALIQNLTLLDLSATPTFERTLFLTVTDADGASTGAQPLLVQVFNGDIENGTPGNDSFAPPGSARIDAGGGIDTVTFNFRLVDATVSYVDNTVVIDTASTHSVLIGVERYVFTDGTVDNNDGIWLLDDLFYYSKYHDVWNARVDADQHYADNGWHEGRDPDAFFSTTVYLSANPDVAAGGVNPLAHYAQFGWKEGRLPSINFDPAQYLAANPDVDAANVDPLAHFLQFGAGEGRLPFAPTSLVTANGFDYVFYLNNNPDVAASGSDPFQHFMTVGWTEGRNPNAFFDTNGYLANYADVDAANVNPLVHYSEFGWHEGRDPSVGFDTTSYLAAYPDVQAANVNPLVHFLHFGINEGRSAFPDGIWG